MTLIVRSETPSTHRTVVWLEGRLDAANYAALDEALRDITPLVDNGGTLVVDLSALEYISSAGLRSLAQLRKSMHDRDARTLLLNPQPQVKKVFEIVKAVPIAEVFATVAELDQYLDHMQRQVSGTG
ncbi:MULTISPECIES: STAS domain-containing protein [unclassified Luteibacter]|uniref:STAS domain-containing protein n=1 Tax=unclassified Luteibacter TaxID=2620188 RepID=UPI0008D865FD|nr:MULTISPECIES: STAS domain-containing protein [unclassified Luteibacter]MDR6938312.1 anti-anti-sigma factor [Luteibacter sp. 3190]SEW03788.1 anti-anti-sigma factor [Luteibacter sp. 329MFSha]